MTEPRFRAVNIVIFTTLPLLVLSIAAQSGMSQQAAPAAQAPAPDLVLEGMIVGSQNQTYVQVPFNVPGGHSARHADSQLHGQGGAHSA